MADRGDRRVYRNQKKERGMKIYHGSLEVVENPMILQPNRLLDYGKGFYTTTSEQQLPNRLRNGQTLSWLTERKKALPTTTI